MIDVSVILCTYNRCELLAKALESAAALTLPAPLQMEILVVDNNSRDRTREVIETVCRQYPDRFRYLSELKQGLGHARNAGIREARGEIIVFMDDDVSVDSDWVERLTAKLHSREWSGAGGRVVPEKTFTPPAWLALSGPCNLGGVLALFDPGDKSGALEQPPFGANMAFRKEMFAKYGDFRVDLGRVGNNLMSGEDTEFGRRLMEGGERLWYEPSAIVYHVMPENRIKKTYFQKWLFDYGRTLIREDGRRPDVLGIPRSYFTMMKLVAKLAGSTFRWMLAVQPQRKFFHKVTVWMIAGQIVEGYRLWFAAGKPGRMEGSVRVGSA